MTITVNHAKTNAISDWTQAQLDEQIALGNFPAGTTLANIVLPSDWNDDHTLTGLGTMAEQNANTVAITGGSVNGTTIGATTASTGTFTTLIGGANVANYGQLTGGATTKAVEFVALGTDSNISIALDSKGTGAIDLAAGSSGVNISNGGTVTAITRTAVGTNYTTNPTVAISAPTTAGGVQATATVPIGVASFTVSNGGTGYAVGNVLTMVGGTFTSAGTCTVSAVSGGVITAVTATSTGTYTAAPTNPASVTGGAGTGATFTLNFGVLSTFTITNAGSGYIEQPTITFSGGGGSGAAAYATVGSGTIVKGIGASTISGVTNSSIVFQTPNTVAPNFLMKEVSGSDSFLVSSPNSGYSQLIASGNANAILKLGSNGTGSVYLNTNGFNETNQMRVAHTASAVNYVQINGGATGSSPTITSQGSDSSIGLQFSSKSASIIFVTRSGNQRSFNILDSVLPVNYLQVQGNTTGVAPILSAQGTDTNIDLALTPKGTGVVQFGSYTATVTAVAGYITIKDSGGTTRKLAVLT